MACKTSQDLPLKEMLLQVMLGCGHGTFLLHRVTWQMLTDGDRINQHSDVNQADGRFGQCVLYFRRYTGNVTRNLTSIPLECTNAGHIQQNMTGLWNVLCWRKDTISCQSSYKPDVACRTRLTLVWHNCFVLQSFQVF